MPLPAQTPYACVDPQLGEQLWRLEAPDLGASLRVELEAHLEVCAACRQLRALAAATERLAKQGRLGDADPAWRMPPLRPRILKVRRLAGLALAASLAMALLLPPRSVEDRSISRGEGEPGFLRPAEGEVLATPRPSFRWTAIAGASAYRLEIRDPAGAVVWNGESLESRLQVPAEAELRRGQSYRALLLAQPADLLPPGKISVAFRVDSPWRMAWHRLRWANPLLQASGALALALVGLLSFRRRSL